MNEWWQSYISKPWLANPDPPVSYNCGELVRYIYREHLGIDLAPIAADASDLRQCIGAMSGSMYGLTRLEPDQYPGQYDVAFMSRAKFDDHCGLAVETSDGLMILHCQQGAGVVLDTPFELMVRGFRQVRWFRKLGEE